MPTLTNPKHERFAQELAKGTSAAEAFVIAGFKANDGNARRLRANEAVVKRVEALLSERADIHERGVQLAVEKVGLTKEWVIGRLIENVERSMQAVEIKRPDGTGTGEYRYDGSVANRALELLGKEQGMFVDRKEVRVGALDVLNANDRDRVRDAVRRELERRAGGDRAPGEPGPDQPLSALH